MRTITDFGADTASADNTASIKAAIAALGDGETLLFPEGTFIVEPSTAGLEAWEVFPAVFQLPNKRIRLQGVPGMTLLKKGPSTTAGGGNAVCMFRTAYASTAAIQIEGIHIQGVGNNGSNGNLIDGLVINGSSNGYFDVTVDRTKRHGIYVIAGAAHNTVKSRRVSNANREQDGCGIEMEGGSWNIVDVDEIVNIGSNGVDLNEWTPQIYYPTGGASPYPAHGAHKSTHNTIRVGRIDNIGFNNHADGAAGFGTWNGDDDYYALSISYGSDFNTWDIGEIVNVRVSNGTIPPHASTTTSAIRLLQANGNSINVGKIQYVGPGSAGWLVRFNGPTDGNVVHIVGGYDYFRAIYDPDSNNSGNSVIVRNSIGTIDLESMRGLSFGFVQQPTMAGQTDGRIDGWTGAASQSYAPIPEGITVNDGGGSFEQLSKLLRFTYNYVIVGFFYNMSASANAAPVAALNAFPFTALQLRKDGRWHHASLIIVYTDGAQPLIFTPNNSGSPAPGASLQLSRLSISLPDGTVVHDPAMTARLRGPPTIGPYNAGDRVENFAPAPGQPKAWRCTAAGTPGSWVSEGNL